jgi:adenylate kinase
MRKYVITGVQGSGKGTQSQMLAADLDIVHISVGDMFRWHVSQHTRLGAEVGQLMATGQLVPDEVTQALVRDRLAEHDWNYGFVLDGFPRDAAQAEFFLANYDVDAVIHLDMPDSEVWRRVEKRRRAAQCDTCGAPVMTESGPREDDTAEAVSVRVREYHARTGPVLDLFRRKGEYVVTVDARPEAEAVQQEIRSKLGLPPYKGEPDA